MATTTTTTQAQMQTGLKQSGDAQQKIQELRELYADAPELSRRHSRTYSKNCQSRLRKHRHRFPTTWTP
jgi:hypothetical protein